RLGGQPGGPERAWGRSPRVGEQPLPPRGDPPLPACQSPASGRGTQLARSVAYPLVRFANPIFGPRARKGNAVSCAALMSPSPFSLPVLGSLSSQRGLPTYASRVLSSHLRQFFLRLLAPTGGALQVFDRLGLVPL